MRTLRHTLLLPLATLAACGGGTPLETMRGQVIGSYYRNATVCQDLNANLKCDAGEPSTVTGTQGDWILQKNLTAGLIAEIGTGATRIESGVSSPVARKLVFRLHPTLVAAGATTLSAISTGLSADLDAGRGDADARAAMAARIGVDVSKLLTDFNAESDAATQGLLKAHANRLTTAIEGVVANGADLKSDLIAAIGSVAPASQQGSVKYAWVQVGAADTPFSKLEITGLDTGGSLTDDPTKVDIGAAKAVTVLQSPDAKLYGTGTMVVRAIVQPDASGRASCPSVVVDGVARAMGTRAAPVTGVVSNGPRYGSPAAVDFPVLTCEATLPADATSASVAGQPLRIAQPGKAVNRVVVVGDTGCRLKGPTAFVQAADGTSSGGDPLQDCTSEAAWPWAKIARVAASFEPDLILHNGDIHYREGFPEGVQKRWGGAANAANGGSDQDNTGTIKPKFVAAKIDDSITYGWRAWEEDFFRAAGPLLGAAPWAITRGNHELCDRAGQGWFRFLDPRAFPTAEPAYDAAYKPGSSFTVTRACSQFIDPVTAVFGDLQLVLLDASMMNSGPGLTSSKGATNVDHVRVARQLTAISALPASTDPTKVTWIVSHKPFFAYSGSASAAGNVPKGAGADTWQLQKAIAPGVESVATGNGSLPANTQMTHAGHIHGFQLISHPASANLPINVLMGTTGDNLEGLIEANTGAALAKDVQANGITGGAWPWFDQVISGVTVKATQWYGSFASIRPENFSSSPVTGAGRKETAINAEFSFLVIDRIPGKSDWTLKVYDQDRKLLRTCTTSGRSATCSNG